MLCLHNYWLLWRWWHVSVIWYNCDWQVELVSMLISFFWNCNRAEVMKKANGQYFPEEVWFLLIEIISLFFCSGKILLINIAYPFNHVLCAEIVEMVRSIIIGSWLSAFQLCSAPGSQSRHLSIDVILYNSFLCGRWFSGAELATTYFYSAPISFLPKIKMFV